MDNLVNKHKHTLQWYIYAPLENWFATPIKKICLDEDTLIYDGLSYPTYSSFLMVKYVEINCETGQAIRVQHHVNRMVKECQYKMPWINELTYFLQDDIHYLKKWQKIKAKLVEINALQYLLDKQTVSIDWFGKKRIMIYEFSPRLSESKQAAVDLIFRFSVDDDAKDNQIFISKPLPLHRAKLLPSPLYIRPLECFGIAYLKTLSLEDILSLEMAHNDHRFEICPGTNFMLDIERELRLRLEFLKNPQQLKCILINEFKLPEVLCYFINKYHQYFLKFYVPNILTKFDRVSMSRMCGIKVLNKQNYDITINFKYRDGAESFVLNYKTFGNRAGDFNVNNPYIPRLYKFDCMTERKFVQLPRLTAPIYNPNEYIEIYIKNRHDTGSKYINKVLNAVIDQFRNHDREQLKLILDQLNFDQISKRIFSSTKDTFGCIEFLNTIPTRSFVLLWNYGNSHSTTKINFKDCRLIKNNVIYLVESLYSDLVPRINILGDNYLDASVYFEIILALNGVTGGSVEPGPATLSIPDNCFPNFSIFKNKLDWRGATLERKLVNDCTIKYDLVKNGEVVDLWSELNGIAHDSVPCYGES